MSLPIRILTWLLLLSLSAAVPLGAEELCGRVSWIYDGDTLRVDKIGKVRLIGIDAPETLASERDSYYQHKFAISPSILRTIARQGKSYLIDEVKGERVCLITDGTAKDKYGRYLAYVYLSNGKLLNEQLLEMGLATVYRRFSFTKKERFLDEETRARRNGLGLWQTVEK